ncbi:hypothetical protein Poli38472_005036 [Pythium oligandrum]|uniref:START domain-containing protein n=1 Tax=Pythium oligandrum TaxID=41045 RepID=A0A8K1CG66_PYTOL|nr:hypothetical protein Poli38472_005036 [Pythium oligandrum]|eukprot:TMW62418.1 hypothetical protein Poli38472_005036 [Pythium oligandrum]
MGVEYTDGRSEFGSSRSMSTAPSSSSSLQVVSDDPRECAYCANLKLIRDVLPPKRCDYCNKHKCQFCTLKFPLIHVKKLPKSMKGNSRICLPCFSERWQGGSRPQNGSSSRESMAGRYPEYGDSQRDSMMMDAAWAGKESFDEAMFGSMRDSLMRESISRDSITRESIMGSSIPTIMENDESETEEQQGFLRRVAGALGLVLSSDNGSSPSSRDVIHVVELWLSLFAAAVLLLITLTEGLTLQQRASLCVVTYGVFLMIHPWIHNVSTGRSMASAAQGKNDGSAVTQMNVSQAQLIRSVPGALPDEYRRKVQSLEDEMAIYLSADYPWKFVKSTSGGKVFESSNSRSIPIFKIESFIGGISIEKFLSYLHRTSIKDRSVWDFNIAKSEVAETFSDKEVKVMYNLQKSFLGGLVSARDFCLLYVTRKNYIVYGSIEHPNVPEKPNATRGSIHFSCFHCTEAQSEKGEPGFFLRYVCQVDIAGNIPQRLQYNGFIDAIEKNMKAFKQAKKLFNK